jgi:hypothetical protein
VLASWIPRKRGLLLYKRTLARITAEHKTCVLPYFIFLARRDIAKRAMWWIATLGAYSDGGEQDKAVFPWPPVDHRAPTTTVLFSPTSISLALPLTTLCPSTPAPLDLQLFPRSTSTTVQGYSLNSSRNWVVGLSENEQECVPCLYFTHYLLSGGSLATPIVAFLE